MKNLIKPLTLAFIFGGTVGHAQVVLQDFSSVVGTNTVFSGTWGATGTGDTASPNANFSQGTGVYNFTGSTPIIPTNSSTSFVEFFNSPRINIGSNNSLSVTAQALAGNASSSFTVILIDALGITASAAFDSNDFVTGSYSTNTKALTPSSGFNPASIDSFRISGNQPGGTAAFGFSFDNISAVSAVPEPSTYAFVAGLGSLSVAAWCRRTRNLKRK